MKIDAANENDYTESSRPMRICMGLSHRTGRADLRIRLLRAYPLWGCCSL